MRRRQLLALSALSALPLAGCTGREPSTVPFSAPDCRPNCETPTTSYVFVTESRLRTQIRRVRDDVEPFATAYEEFISRATRSFAAEPRSVADDTGDDHGPHRFEADTNDRADYRAALETSFIARDCALAYWFTRDDLYARKVVDVIHHFFLGDGTYMEPNSVIPNGNGAIRQHIWMPAFIYAASFVRGHPRWSRYDGSRPWDGGDSGDAESAFGQWIVDWHDTFADSEPEWCVKNNRWPWRIANKAAVAAYLGDDELMTTAKRMYRAEIRNDCAPDRHWSTLLQPSADQHFLNSELDRDTDYAYEVYHVLADAMCCVAFETWDGSDLWSFKAPTDDDHSGGQTLRQVYNWEPLREATKNPDVWTSYTPEKGLSLDQSGESIREDGDNEEGAVIYELGYARWGQWKSVLDEADAGGRPYWDRRVLGPVTLTHGRP